MLAAGWVWPRRRARCLILMSSSESQNHLWPTVPVTNTFTVLHHSHSHTHTETRMKSCCHLCTDTQVAQLITFVYLCKVFLFLLFGVTATLQSLDEATLMLFCVCCIHVSFMLVWNKSSMTSKHTTFHQMNWWNSWTHTLPYILLRLHLTSPEKCLNSKYQSTKVIPKLLVQS